MQTAVKQQKGLTGSILAEIDREAAVTRQLFEIIPEDRLSWRPHPKAKSLGELAAHIANTQSNVARLTEQDTTEFYIPPDKEAASRAEILEIFAKDQQTVRDIITAGGDDYATAEWTLTRNGKTIMVTPRAEFWRSIMLNHYYHHRGQLSTYLRQLDVKLPSIYGPTADTDPFAQ